MMKHVLLVVLVAGLAAVFFWQKDDPSQALQQMPAWVVLDAAKVAAIELRSANGEPVVLKKVAEQWQLADGRAADPVAVERLLGDLAAMRPVRVVTRKRSHDAELGMDARGTAILLSDAGGAHLLDATIGKQGPNLVSTYLRLKGSDTVLAMDKALNWQVQRSAGAWKKAVAAPAAPSADAYAAPLPLDGYDAVDAYARVEP